MIRHFGTEPPWRGIGEFGSWVEGERLWDGTQVWEYREPVSNWVQILTALPFASLVSPKVEWLEDKIFPVLAAS